MLAALGCLLIGPGGETGFPGFCTQAEGGSFLRAFNGMVVVDGFAVFLNVLFAVSGLVG
jgi:hypothetical protein